MLALPNNYEQIVREGVQALGWLEAVIERRIQRSGETAARLLAFRDVTGLARRLASAEPFEWHEGWLRTVLSPQDIGVLKEWELEASQIVHSPEDPEPGASSGYPVRLHSLRCFLERYLA